MAVANGVVVVGSRNGVLFAFDEFTGNLLWTANTLLLAEPFTFGATGMLGIVENYVTAVTLGLTVSVFDLRTGAALGTLGGAREGIRDVQPLRGSQAFNRSPISLSILDLATGIKRWEVITPRFAYRRDFAVLAGDTLFDANSEFGLRSFKLPP